MLLKQSVCTDMSTRAKKRLREQLSSNLAFTYFHLSKRDFLAGIKQDNRAMVAIGQISDSPNLHRVLETRLGAVEVQLGRSTLISPPRQILFIPH